MTPEENTNLKQPSKTTNGIYRFLIGAAIGVVLVIIPASYASFIDWSLTQLSMVLLVVLLCGLLNLWSEKFMDAITRVLDSFAA